MRYSFGSRGNRGKTYSFFEDQTLCSSFLDIAQEQPCDPEKMQVTFWERVLNDYNNKIHVDQRYRTSGSLRNRWSTIRTEVSKFCECIAKVQTKHQSKTVEADMVVEAKKMYRAVHERQFLFESCWSFLRSNSGWEELISTKSKKNPSLLNVAVSNSANLDLSAPGLPTPSTPISLDSDIDHELPEGTKDLAVMEDARDSPQRNFEDMVGTLLSEKESEVNNSDSGGTGDTSSSQKESPNKKRDHEGTDTMPPESPKKRGYESMVENVSLQNVKIIEMVQNMSPEQLQVLKMINERQQRKEEEEIMLKDTSNMNDIQKVYYDRRRAEILARLNNDISSA